MEDNPALDGDDHQAIEQLLPWYVTSQLDTHEADVVEAHLATCDACRTMLAEERALCESVAALPIATDAAWVAFRRRLVTAPPTRRKLWARRAMRSVRSDRFGWLVAAQAAILLAVVGIGLPLLQAPPEYRGLSGEPSTGSGNIVAVFQPETTVQQMRLTLESVGATIVGGPTGSDAYILRVPEASRTERLARLRRQRAVVLAEAIDGGPQP